MSCSTASTPSEFFGQTPLDLGGQIQFYEFLQSITDAPILVRNGLPQETALFIDAQTKSITVAMVTFAPEYGLASTISITATLSTEVSVDFAVGHFQSLEGDQLQQYRWVSYIGFVLAVVILIEKVVTIAHKNVRAEIPGFVVDFIIQVFLPIVYFSIRLSQVAASKASILETVGTEGLAGVPWSSRSVSLGSKVGQFFDGLEKFEAKLSNESLMGTFYFVHATAALFRLIFQTSAHPRTAILVNTMIQAAGDLWSFTLSLSLSLSLILPLLPALSLCLSLSILLSLCVCLCFSLFRVRWLSLSHSLSFALSFSLNFSLFLSLSL